MWNNYHSVTFSGEGVQSKRIYGTPSDEIPIVSIMIPTFHRSDLLKEALDSALNQTGMDGYEVVVVDNDENGDAATDELMQAYCLKHKNLLYYRNENNLGMPGNWNRCIELSRSEYFCILHDDDLLLPNYLKTMVPYTSSLRFGAIGVFNQYLDRTSEDIFTNYRVSSDRGKRTIEKIRGGRLIPYEPLDSIRDMRPNPTACFYNKSACLQAGGFDFKSDGEGLTSDNLFFYVLNNECPVYTLPRILALRGVSCGDSSDPSKARNGIIGNYEVNCHVMDEVGKRKKRYEKLSQIMTVGMIQSYKATYGVSINKDELCKRLDIPKKVGETPIWKITLLKMLTWGMACFRPEPTDAKRASRAKR